MECPDANRLSEARCEEEVKRTKKPKRVKMKRHQPKKTEPVAGGKHRFDQLLDDAVLGVKKK
jgi:hypothetical protein